jgi:hypothetical protein
MTASYQLRKRLLQGMFDRLIEIGKCYGMQMNMEKSKAIEWN